MLESVEDQGKEIQFLNEFRLLNNFRTFQMHTSCKDLIVQVHENYPLGETQYFKIATNLYVEPASAEKMRVTRTLLDALYEKSHKTMI